MTRKDFLQKAGAVVALSSLGVSLESCSDDDNPTPDLGNGLNIDLTQAPFDEVLSRGWVLHPEENVLIVNWEGEVRAFTSVCTHEGCARDWVFGRGVFTCTCHSSRFSHRGEVLSGPASKNLAEFSVVQIGDVLMIS